MILWHDSHKLQWPRGCMGSSFPSPISSDWELNRLGASLSTWLEVIQTSGFLCFRSASIKEIKESVRLKHFNELSME